MTVVLYNIPELNVERNNMIRFQAAQQRHEYLSHVPSKVFDIDSVGAKQNLWDLNIDVALYDNFRNPERDYNYAKIVQDSKEYFYYILGWKELGSNQVSYTLQLDTLQMAFGVAGQNELDLDVTTNPQLITREHRDRFDFNTNRALFNDVPESGDNSTPVVLTENVIEATGNVRARLVYKNRTDSKPVAYPYVESPLSVPVTGSDWIGVVYSQLQDLNTTDLMYTWDGDFEYTLGEGVPNIHVIVPSNHYVKYIRSGSGNRTLSTYNKTTGNVVVTN